MRLRPKTIIQRFVFRSLVILLLPLSGCGGGGGSSTRTENAALIADAGNDQTVQEQAFAFLDGTRSTGNIKTYSWSQTGGPAVTLENAQTATARYRAPQVANGSVSLAFTLTVSDGNGRMATDTVVDTVVHVNTPPVADAGRNQSVAGQTPVTLSGSGTDADGTIVSYRWTQVAGPAVTLQGSDTTHPSFTAPATTASLTFRLTVTDNSGATGSDEVTVGVSRVMFSDDFSQGSDVNGWTSHYIDDSNDPSSWQAPTFSAQYLLQGESVERGPNSLRESYHRGTYSFYSSGSSWTNYRLRVEVTPLADTGDDVGVMFRYRDNENYYRLTFNARYGFRRLERQVASVFTPLAVDAIGYVVGQTLDVVVEVNGSLIQVWVNDDPIFSVTDSSIFSGTIALYCQDKAKFDNVLVTENSPLPGVVIGSPLAYSVNPGSTLEATASATNVPTGGSVQFILDGAQSVVDASPPFSAQFPNVKQGEHELIAILRDASGIELARDTNAKIGVLGGYYVAVGDSITNGEGDNYSADNVSQDGRIVAIQGYEATLSDLLTLTRSYPHIIFNEGIGGDTAQLAAYYRIDSIIKRHPRAKQVLVLLGTNDAIDSTITISEYTTSMQALVRTVHEAQRTPVVGLIPPIFSLDGTPDTAANQRIESFNKVIDGTDPVYRLVDHQVGADFYDYFLGAGKNRSSLFADTLHPNGLGHRVMAYLWHNALNPEHLVDLPLVLNDLAPLNYKQNLLEGGDRYYIDELFTLTTIPAILQGGVWVMTANADRGNTNASYLSFTVDRNVTVFAAYDASASVLPLWLRPPSFSDTGTQVETTNPTNRLLRVYRKDYPKGSSITLGGNHSGGGTGACNYIVMVRAN